MVYYSAPNTAGKVITVPFENAAALAKADITLPTQLPDMDLKTQPIVSIGVVDPTAPATTNYTAANFAAALGAGTFYYTQPGVAGAGRKFQLGDAIANACMITICYKAAGNIKHT